METRLRSWAKSVTWRIVGIVILGGISYAMTRDWKETTVITAVFHTLRFVLDYYHERVWMRIKWGTQRHPLSHLPVKKDLTTADHEAIRQMMQERNWLNSKEYEI